jgi:hypothetical protein
MDLCKVKDIAEMIQAIVTSLAIIVGGIWTYLLFVRRRQKYPRAILHHDVAARFLGDGLLLVHVAATITNTGEVLLRLVSAETRVQQILPPPTDFMSLAKSGQDPVEGGQTEVRWPLLCERRTSYAEGSFQIEPGECDSIHYDFFVNNEVRTLEIYTYLKNQKIRERDVGWSATTLFDIQSSKSEE